MGSIPIGRAMILLLEINFEGFHTDQPDDHGRGNSIFSRSCLIMNPTTLTRDLLRDGRKSRNLSAKALEGMWSLACRPRFWKS
jgi:hypothetical protein